MFVLMSQPGVELLAHHSLMNKVTEKVFVT